MVIWDIDAQGIDRVIDELRQATDQQPVDHQATAKPPRGYVCDIADRQAVYRTAQAVVRDVGPIDILINNAGIVSGQRFLDCSDEQIERSLKVNTMALFWTAKAFLPAMIESGQGHVVTVASAAGTIGVARLADYAASKWAAVGFDESLRMELRRLAPGVRTTVACPYYIDTGMFHGVRTRWPWLLPILQEDIVAKKIVRAIERNQARLMMPPLVYLVPALRLLPTRWFDAAADLLGINATMDHFVGRRKEPVDEPTAIRGTPTANPEDCPHPRQNLR